MMKGICRGMRAVGAVWFMQGLVVRTRQA